MYATINDAQVISLIPACQRGESGAIEALYGLYADRIYHYLLARTGDTSAAEDLTTEVFLRVIEHIEKFKLNRDRPASSVSAWLYRIAANLVADHHRKQQRHPVVDLEAEEMLAAPEWDPCREVEERERLARLTEALDKLTEDQRVVVISKFGEGMSNLQVAAWLGKTEGAVEALQHRALRTLGRLLGMKQAVHER
jgi:RNA polymerase sigma-70 factor (ECF subfamily)